MISGVKWMRQIPRVFGKSIRPTAAPWRSWRVPRRISLRLPIVHLVHRCLSQVSCLSRRALLCPAKLLQGWRWSGTVARVPMARSRRDGRRGDASFSGGKAITFSHIDHVMSMSHHDTRAFTAMAVWAQIDSCHVACHCPCCLSSAGNSFMQVRSPSLHGMRGRQADQFRLQWPGSARLHHRG